MLVLKANTMSAAVARGFIFIVLPSWLGLLRDGFQELFGLSAEGFCGYFQWPCRQRRSTILLVINYLVRIMLFTSQQGRYMRIGATIASLLNQNCSQKALSGLTSLGFT